MIFSSSISGCPSSSGSTAVHRHRGVFLRFRKHRNHFGSPNSRVDLHHFHDFQKAAALLLDKTPTKKRRLKNKVGPNKTQKNHRILSLIAIQWVFDDDADDDDDDADDDDDDDVVHCNHHKINIDVWLMYVHQII